MREHGGREGVGAEEEGEEIPGRQLEGLEHQIVGELVSHFVPGLILLQELLHVLWDLHRLLGLLRLEKILHLCVMLRKEEGVGLEEGDGKSNQILGRRCREDVLHQKGIRVQRVGVPIVRLPLINEGVVNVDLRGRLLVSNGVICHRDGFVGHTRWTHSVSHSVQERQQVDSTLRGCWHHALLLGHSCSSRRGGRTRGEIVDGLRDRADDRGEGSRVEVERRDGDLGGVLVACSDGDPRKVS
mmetsp:Transcript_2089/g.3682  ORF Transcript_2089/g.3682 Transcript_2089/m.3682 type:complete len:242 (+) Transcript_2089:945-1670(+)